MFIKDKRICQHKSNERSEAVTNWTLQIVLQKICLLRHKYVQGYGEERIFWELSKSSCLEWRQSFWWHGKIQTITLQEKWSRKYHAGATVVERVLWWIWRAQLPRSGVIRRSNWSLFVCMHFNGIHGFAIVCQSYPISNCTSPISRSRPSGILDSPNSICRHSFCQHLGWCRRSVGTFSSEAHAGISREPSGDGLCWI